MRSRRVRREGTVRGDNESVPSTARGELTHRDRLANGRAEMVGDAVGGRGGGMVSRIASVMAPRLRHSSRCWLNCGTECGRGSAPAPIYFVTDRECAKQLTCIDHMINLIDRSCVTRNAPLTCCSERTLTWLLHTGHCRVSCVGDEDDEGDWATAPSGSSRAPFLVEGGSDGFGGIEGSRTHHDSSCKTLAASTIGVCSKGRHGVAVKSRA